MVIALLKVADMFKPSILAKQETVNKHNQVDQSIPEIPRIQFPMSTNDKVCTALIKNSIPILEMK